MKTYLQAYFDKLKILVLNKAKINQLVPADCYRLALEIKAETNKSISETTIKRVFGFASSVHQPSIYTLNTLAQYCGFDCWDDFYTLTEQSKLQPPQQKMWSEILLNATKISLFNIQSNKHKCGIPYHLTVDREHMHTFMEQFDRSGATIGILSGPAGYGKTVTVSRWVEQQIDRNHQHSTNDIYLFTNSLSLLHGAAYGYHCNRWLAHLLDFDNSDILDYFMEHYRVEAPGHFYLIIDELHSDLVTDRQFYNVINQFVEMVRNFAQFKWFRIILVLRTVTLRRYENLFRDTIINPQWFSVLSGTQASESANMTAFSGTELHELVRNISGVDNPYHTLKPRSKHLINIPLFFQYYYELNGKKLDISHITPFDEYIIITQYLKKKVFNGINTLAKQGLMEELCAMVEERDKVLQVSKKQAYATIKHYRTAYNDLLYVGILHEVNCGLEVRQQTAIRFQTDAIAAYFMALHLFNNHDDTVKLIKILDQSEISNKAKTEQLKWLLLFYIESGDLRLVNQFPSIPFIGDDRFEIVAFICDALHKFGNNATQSVRHQLNQALYDCPFIDDLLNHTCFQTEYETNVAKLLDFDLSDNHEIMLRSKIAFIAMLKWEEEVFLDQLEKLSMKRPEAYACFVANPLMLLSYLYQFFKGKSINQEVACELNALYHRLPVSDTLISNQVFDLLVYFVAKVSGRTEIVHAYKRIIRQRLDSLSLRKTADLGFTKLIYALYLFECGEEQAISEYMPQNPTGHDNDLSYRLLHMILCIRAGKLKRSGDFQRLGQQAISICETYKFKLLEAYCRILILEEVPKGEQSYHINNLKFQFAAFGYTPGLKSLSKKYG